MDIKEFCRNLERLLGNRNLHGDGLDTAIKAICQGLAISTGEIAILLMDKEDDVLHFLWPRGLQKSGTIPASSKESLAARTFREGAGTINNRFSTIRHSSIFEAFPLKEFGGRALPIQKIISVPLGRKKSCLGVLQICRKASDPTEAGPDFTPRELLGAGLIARILARHL
jgi:hypothetical protein